jgi:integrase
MLLQGLRSKEVIALNCEDVFLSESQMRVRGKGNKIRFLPLASDTVLLLNHYLRLERPEQCGPALFVSLQGPARGARMTPAGLRSLFRHHRRVSQTAPAHPHRFRHTFASDIGSRWHQPACAHAVDGTCSHLDHYGLRANLSPRCL